MPAVIKKIVSLWLLLLLTGNALGKRQELSRRQAIKIARQHVSFQPTSIKAIKTTVDDRPVWRITFRGAPISQVNLIGEVVIISVDRFSGKIVAISKS